MLNKLYTFLYFYIFIICSSTVEVLDFISLISPPLFWKGTMIHSPSNLQGVTKQNLNVQRKYWHPETAVISPKRKWRREVHQGVLKTILEHSTHLRGWLSSLFSSRVLVFGVVLFFPALSCCLHLTERRALHQADEI